MQRATRMLDAVGKVAASVRHADLSSYLFHVRAPKPGHIYQKSTSADRIASCRNPQLGNNWVRFPMRGPLKGKECHVANMLRVTNIPLQVL